MGRRRQGKVRRMGRKWIESGKGVYFFGGRKVLVAKGMKAIF